jgi:hypothetical protein
MTVKAEVRKLTPRQREGRAVNAIAELLRRTLSVPNIYIDPPSNAIAADLLAVDRGGAGDLHAVEIKLEKDLNPSEGSSGKLSTARDLNQSYSTWYPRFSRKVQGIHRQLMATPAHFRYLAIPKESLELTLGELGNLGLFSDDGIGRIGVITIKEEGEEPLIAEIAIAPERFRVDPTKLQNIETKLLAKSRPDIEVRI